MEYTRFSSPLGEILLCGSEAGLHSVVLVAEDAPDPQDAARDDEALRMSRDQLLGYLAGRRRHFSVDLAPGGSDFQRQVWARHC